MLLAAATIPVAVARAAGNALGSSAGHDAAVIVAVAAFAAAAWAMVAAPRWGRALATVAILGNLALALPWLVASPAVALAFVVVAICTIALTWGVASPYLHTRRIPHRPVAEGQAQGAALVGLATWFVVALASDDRGALEALVGGWGLLLTTGLALEVAWRRRRSRPRQALVVAVLGVGGLLVGAWHWRDPWWTVSALVPTAVLVATTIRPPASPTTSHTSWSEVVLGHPERLFVGTFAGMCLLGGIVLALPQAAAAGKSIGFIDALFTSASAVCVTGLIVLDTPVDFSTFGQATILVLIQIGGLGIMTFSTAALWALGRRLSLRHEGAVASLISTRDRGRVFETAQRIVMLTLVVEGAGALILTGAFVAHGQSIGAAAWRGVFTSISAFCNAGFALDSDSLIAYQSSPIVLYTVAASIVLGGLSPLVVFVLPDMVRRVPRPVSAQARLSLWTSVILIVVGFVAMLALEWSSSLAGLSPLDRIHNAFFQSVTLRTAGFNSVDLTQSRSASLTVMLVWMFIGGSPGGTAGGIKTTTVAVLGLAVAHAIRGRWTVEAFGKRISQRTIAKAAVVVAVAVTTGFLALLAIQLTQAMSTRVAAFEVVSALGTVGLSIGGTAELDGIGKTIIIACMFVGRVGGLTLLMFLHSRRAPPTMGRPEEDVDVG